MARNSVSTGNNRWIGAAVDAVVFDVFGTVVDWRTGVAREFERVGTRAGVQADWLGLTTAWRSRYPPTLLRVVSGEVPWRSLDELHRMMLDDVLTEHGLTGFTDTDRAELVSAWHRPSPWPDSRDGLSRLRETHITATLSNGSTALLIHLARAGGLTFEHPVRRTDPQLQARPEGVPDGRRPTRSPTAAGADDRLPSRRPA
jgi:2-haloacid dehalogenase